MADHTHPAIHAANGMRAIADAAAPDLLTALKLVSAILQAEMGRKGGEPFTGEWFFPAINVRSSCSDALDMADAVLARTENPTEYDSITARLEALHREMTERPGDFVPPVQHARWADQVETLINEQKEVTAWGI